MKNYITGISTTLTDFNTGSRVRTIIEALSLIAEELNLDWFRTLNEATTEAIYKSFDFERVDGIKSSGTLTFGRDVANGEITIPIGTQISYNEFIIETLVEATILDGELESEEVNSQFTIASSTTNIGIGGINTKVGRGSFVDKPDDVDYVHNETAYTGGTNIESDEDRIERFQTFIQGLTRTTPIGQKAGALTVYGIRSVNIKENVPSPGWVRVYAEEGDGSLSEIKRTELLKVLKGDSFDPNNFPGYRASGIHIEVLAPEITNITYNVTVKMLTSSDYVEVDLIDLVKTAIINYTNNLPLSYDVISSEVVTSIQNADSDIYDVIINSPTGDKVNIEEGFLAKTNSGIIMVNVIEVTY